MRDPIAVLSLVMDAVTHRKVWLGGKGIEEAGPVLADVLADLEAGGIDTSKTREWLEAEGITLPANAERVSGGCPAGAEGGEVAQKRVWQKGK